MHWKVNYAWQGNRGEKKEWTRDGWMEREKRHIYAGARGWMWGGAKAKEMWTR